MTWKQVSALLWEDSITGHCRKEQVIQSFDTYTIFDVSLNSPFNKQPVIWNALKLVR